MPQNVEPEHGAFSGLFDLLDEAVEAGNGLAIQRQDDIGGSEAAFFRGPVRRRQDDEQGMRLIEAERLDGGGVQVSQFGAEPARFGRGGLGRGRRRGSAVLRDGERGLRRQEQQGEQRAAKHSVKRLEGNACNNVPIHSDPPSATLPGDN